MWFQIDEKDFSRYLTVCSTTIPVRARQPGIQSYVIPQEPFIGAREKKD